MRSRRESTTVNVRVSRSWRALSPLPVRAVMVTLWRPSDSFGSGTVTVSNASARSPLTCSPRLSESTAKVTGDAGLERRPERPEPDLGSIRDEVLGGDGRVGEERQPDRDRRSSPRRPSDPSPIAEAPTRQEVEIVRDVES